MEIPEQLLCLFSAEVEQRDGSYVVEIPKREFELDTINEGETYRVGVLSRPTKSTDREKTKPKSRSGSERSPPEPTRGPPEPPVEEGETRVVEIEDIGEQGDGITRVERGYVVIVPDTEKGERVRIEITDVQQNVAFAEVVERISYYE